MYSILALDTVTMRHLGKDLPVGGRDSGVLQDDGVSVAVAPTPPSSIRKRELAAERKRLQREQQASSDVKRAKREIDLSTDGGDGMAAALNNQTRMEGLKTLLGVLPKDTPEYASVLKALLDASGVVVPTINSNE
jgi:hypothetical protein